MATNMQFKELEEMKARKSQARTVGLDEWDPRQDDFQDRKFNSYDRGIGKNLPKRDDRRGNSEGVELYVQNIPIEITQDGLTNLFERHGTVLKAAMISQKNPVSKHTYGFVTMQTVKDAEEAIRQLDGFEINRCRLKVKVAMTKEEKAQRNAKKQDEEDFLKSLSGSKSYNNIHNAGSDATDDDSAKENRGFGRMTNGDCARNTGSSGARGRGGILQTPGHYPAERFNDALDTSVIHRNRTSNIHLNERFVEAPAASLGPGRFQNMSYGQAHDRNMHHGLMQDISRGNTIHSRQHHNAASYDNEMMDLTIQVDDRTRAVLPGDTTAVGRGASYIRNPGGGYSIQPLMAGRGGIINRNLDHSIGNYGQGTLLLRTNNASLGGTSKTSYMSHMTSTPIARGILDEALYSDSRPSRVLGCRLCGQPGPYRCANCKIPYCSEECQKRDWPRHRELCLKDGTNSKTPYIQGFDVRVGDDVVEDTRQRMVIASTTRSRHSSCSDSDHSHGSAKSNQKQKVANRSGNRRNNAAQRDRKSDLNERSKEKIPNRFNDKPQQNTQPGRAKHDNTQKKDERFDSRNTNRNDRNQRQERRDRNETSTRSKPPIQNEQRSAEQPSPSPTIFDLPRKEVEFNIDTQALPCYVASPSEIWMIISNDLLEKQELLKKMCESSTKKVSQVKVNNIYGCVCSKDGEWYRAKVEKVISPDKAEVMYIDYGDTDTVSWTNLRVLERDMLTHPPQAVCCSLFENLDWVWSQEACEEVQCLVEVYKLYVINIEKKIQNKYIITLSDNEGNIKDRLNHTESSNKVFTMADLTTLYPTYSIGQFILFTVVDVNSPSDFTVNVTDEKLLAPFQQLTLDIQKVDGEPYRPKQEEVVIAKYDVDDLWYRALVLSVTDSEAVVQFIDYGNRSIVPFNAIRKPPHCIKDVPVMGVKSALAYSAQSPHFVWSTALTDEFRQLCGSGKHNVKGEIIEKSENLLTLNVTNPLTGESVSEILQKLDPQASVAATDQANRTRQGRTEISEDQIVMAKDMKVSTFPSDRVPVELSMFFTFDNFYLQIKSSAFDSMRAELHGVCCQNKSGYKPVVGELICAKYEVDNDWYRAEVKDVADNSCQVFFSDYGNVDEVQFSQIQKMSRKFSSVPLQAIRCTLSGISCSTDVDQNNLLASNIQVPLSAKYLKQQNSVSEIELFSSDGTSFNKKCAEVLDSLTTVMSTDVKKNNLTVGEEIGSKVSCIMNTEQFYIQLLSAEKDLDSLVVDLNKHGSENETGYCPTIGEVVLVKYTVDANYYRAEVKKKDENKFEVFYLDYGNGETVSAENIQKMTAKFCSLPFQAIECSLVGVPKDSIDEGGLLKFHLATATQPVTAKCRSVLNGVHDVELFTMDGASINKSMISSEDELAKAIGETSTPLCTPQKPVPVANSERTLVCDGISFRLNQDSPARITSIQGLNEFFMIIEEYRDQLERLLNQLNDFCKNDNTSGYSPIVGELVCAFFQPKECWYRAQVRSMKGEDIQVFFVDLGETEVIKKCKIKKIDSQFTTLPLQAIRCSLHNVQHVEHEQIMNAFQSLQNLLVKVKLNRVTDNVNHVELYGIEDGDNYNDIFNIAMTEFGINEAVEVQKHTSDVEATNETSVKQVVEVQKSTSDITTIDETHVKQVAEVQNATCDVITRDEASAYPKNHVIYKSFSSRESDCVITFVYDPNNFYCQDIKDLEALAALTATAPDYCNAMQVQKFLPALGDPCWALFEDGMWYRAIVEKISSDGKFSIFFMDFGNRDEVTADKLRPPNDVFKDVPALAIKCSLFDVKPVGPSWTPQAITKLSEKMNKILKARLITEAAGTADGINEVDLIDINENPNLYINNDLISSGLAKSAGQEVLIDDTASIEQQIAALQALLISKKQALKK